MSVHTKINLLQSRRQVIASAVALSLLPIIYIDPAHAHDSDSTPRVDLQWYDITARTIAAAKFVEAATESRTWAVSWLAAARAIGSPGNSDNDHHEDSNYAVAALATALHDTLAALVPDQQSQLDAALASTLALVPGGPARDQGIAAGQHSAIVVLAERDGDGLDNASINIPFAPPPPGPGVWQPTPPSFGPAARAGLGKARPFLLSSNDQFRPDPPPALDSGTYLDSLAEVRAIGSLTNGLRTADQTDVALFWEDQSVHIFVPALRIVLADSDGSLAQSARLVAAFHVISIDVQIAIYEAKYTYIFWRPVTAIRTGTVDPDPTWTTFFASPRHPEYPSGHCGYAGAVVHVLKALVGPHPQQPISFQSATDPGSTRTYSKWSTFTQENINGRVWEGVHFRFSDEVAADVGQQIARYALPRLRSVGL
jgi:hypothetical protein